ncbi:MAG: GIY-YIG nuclease family protein [Lachnospiraceae bacterium]|nr:GIY-YIG nuclease family protein [Lachnospiraceae bacterium]
MAKRGKNIQLFLMDGDASGRIKCTMANWTGIAYKIPRIYLNECKDRADLKQSGVYFMFGTSGDDEHSIYVGQAGSRKNGEGLFQRIREPHDSIDWTEVITFSTTNNSFGQTEISYLENRFHELAKSANRYTVVNSNSPAQGNITEEKESELEEFIDYAQIIVGTLGHRVFEPVLEASDNNEVSEELILKNSKADAVGARTSDGFVVKKGSKLAATATRSCPTYIRNLRERYKTRIDSKNKLTEDTLFQSPSTAAGFVMYASQNGLQVWLTHAGVQLKALDNSL